MTIPEDLGSQLFPSCPTQGISPALEYLWRCYFPVWLLRAGRRLGPELRPAPSLRDLFVLGVPLPTPLPASPGATDLHLCRDISVELCYSYLEARQPPATPLTSLSPALTELPTAVLTLAFRQTQFMLKEWGSEFSPRKLGALEQPQEESSRQLSIVGAGTTVL